MPAKDPEDFLDLNYTQPAVTGQSDVPLTVEFKARWLGFNDVCLSPSNIIIGTLYSTPWCSTVPQKYSVEQYILYKSWKWDFSFKSNIFNHGPCQQKLGETYDRMIGEHFLYIYIILGISECIDAILNEAEQRRVPGIGEITCQIRWTGFQNKFLCSLWFCFVCF